METFWQVLWALFLFGAESGIVRWYTSIDDESDKRRFLFNVTVFLLFINLIGILIIIPYSEYFSILFFENIIYKKLIIYSSLIAVIETFVFVVFLIIRINQKPLMYSLLSILISLINLGIQFYYIQYTSTKLEGVFIAKLAAPGIILLTLIPYYLKHIKFNWNLKILIPFIKYSFPIMLGSIVITLLNQSDRFILGFLTNEKDVGIYVLGYNICGLISFIVISPFTLAFTVISWNKLKDANAKRFYTKNVTYLYFAVLYFALFISIFTPHFIKIFTLNREYWLAINIIPWIALSLPFYGIHFISVFSFYVTGKTNYILISYILALIINVCLNLILIPKFNMYGAAISNYSSFLSLNLILYYFSKKQYFIKFEWLKILIMTIIAVSLILPFFYFQIESKFLEILLKCLALLVFPILLLSFKFYEPVEIETFKNFIRKKRINKI